jgi:hypothetical protein
MGALWATALRTAFDRAESLLRIPVGEEEPVEDEELEDPQRAVRGDDHVGGRRVDTGHADEDAEDRQARPGRNRGDGAVPEPDGQALPSTDRVDRGADGRPGRGADEGVGRRHRSTVAGRDQSPLGPRCGTAGYPLDDAA